LYLECEYGYLIGNRKSWPIDNLDSPYA